MKYISIKNTHNEMPEHKTRIYTDFYCSLNEWAQLNFRNKQDFIHQVIKKINSGWLEEPEDDELFDYLENIVLYAIKLITHKNANVKCYSYHGAVINVIIEFNNCVMPNIVVLIDEGGFDIIQKTLIYCIDAIYTTLHDKTTTHYDKLLYKYYNNKYDRIFYKSKSNHYGCFLEWKYKWKWSDVFRKAEDRIINKIMCHVTYK